MAKKEKSDKWGSTIGIKHFLNRRLKGKIIDKELFPGGEKEVVRYPLYVQITLKGQSIKVRSFINRFFTSEEFEQYLVTNRIDLEIERTLIKREITEKRPFDDPNYELKWSWLAGFGGEELGCLVPGYLHQLVGDVMQSVIGEKMIRHERFWLRAKTNNLPCRVLTNDEYNETVTKAIESDFSLYQSFYYNTVQSFTETEEANYYSMYMSFILPEMKILRDKFSPEFWDFSNYYHKIIYREKADILSIDDLFTGRFDEVFMATWNDSNALKAIKSGFKALFEEIPELYSRVEKVKEQYT